VDRVGFRSILDTMETVVRSAEWERSPPTTYNERIEQIVGRFPHRVAFRLKTPQGYRQVTYREFHQQSKAVAQGIIGTGLRPGGRVAILSENRPEWVVAYLGTFLAGGTAVPLDPQISPEEWKRLLDDSETQLIFVSGPLLPRLRSVLRDSFLAQRLVCFDRLEGDRDARSELAGFQEWALLSPPTALPQSRLSDVVVIIYTSGTTGQPKGVMLTQENFISEVTAILNSIHADENDTFLCLLPLQHVFASVVNFLLPLYIGAEVTFVDTLKRTEILEALEQAGITILATVPQFFYLFHGRIHDELRKKPPVVRALFRALLTLNRYSLRLLGLNLGKLLFGKIHHTFGSKLRLFVSGGSAFDVNVAQDFHDLGFTILQGYGLTETTGAATVTPVKNNVIGSVGPALPGVQLKIVDPDSAGIGEVAIRGPVVMKGYYKNLEATAAVLKEDWFHSGDLGRLDSRGNLFITGRKKEVIVLPNGKNIYPDELEAHYLQCPYIQEIAVLGISSPGGYERSERLHAVVVPNFEYLKQKKIANAREILRDEIARWSHQLPKYKRLMSYQVQKEPLARTTTRKIKRLELKRQIEKGELQGMEAPAAPPVNPEDQALQNSSFGREVIRALSQTYHRKIPIELDMNLELDLGFDSLERVELLASLEQSLNLRLSEDFGAEIYTVRDLIKRLQDQTTSAAAPASARQSWREILSENLLKEVGEWHVRFSGAMLTFLKHAGLKVFYLIFRIFLRLEVRGLENLPARGPYLICPNHLSYMDPLVVMSVLPYRVFKKVFFVGASEYFTSWPMRFLARLANIVPVDPDAHLLRAMKVGAYGLRQGRILCIFPEGARSFDGELKEFKKGAAILSREVGVPIIPAGLQGTYEVWPRDSWRIRPHKVKVSFGSPLQASDGSEEIPYQADTERLQQAVSTLITNGRAQSGPR
jgi:long-chain acyl-CoA synthetase